MRSRTPAEKIKRALMAARGAFFLLTDSFAGLLPRGKAAGRERVLVVRLDRIGDFLLWLDAARALRELYPADRCELTLLAHPSWAGMAGGLGLFDRVWTLDPRTFVWNLGYRWSRLTVTRRAGFSTVVQARHSRELFVEDALTRASGAPVRAAFDRPDGPETRVQKAVSDRWYTRLVAAPAEMELERNAEFVRALGLPEFRAGVPALATSRPPVALRETPYFVLFPGATWSGRRWPTERFAALAERLSRETGWRGVVCGGPEDRALGEAVARLAGTPLENLAGGTTLDALAGVIAGAELVVTNETSGVHMAAAVGTPSVCVLGGGHFGRFVPYRIETPLQGRPLPLPVVAPMPCFGCDWQCIYPISAGDPAPCIGGIGLEAVWTAVRDVIGAEKLAQRRELGV